MFAGGTCQRPTANGQEFVRLSKEMFSFLEPLSLWHELWSCEEPKELNFMYLREGNHLLSRALCLNTEKYIVGGLSS